MKEKYKHSGKTPPIGVVLGLLVGFVVSIPLAYVYSYGIINVPYIKLRLIFTVLFGMLVGLATGWGLVWGKVRNNFFAGLVGVIVALVAWYISWGSWLLTIFERPYSGIVSLLSTPTVAWQWVLLVNTNGTWSTSGSATTGAELWAIWSLEALTIFGCGYFASSMVVKSRPFCENCDQWCAKSGQIMFSSSIVPAELLARVNAGQYDFLKEAPPARAVDPHYKFVWHSCSTCGALNTVTVSQQTLVKKNKRQTKVWVDQLLLPATEVETLKNWQEEKASLGSKAQVTGNRA